MLTVRQRAMLATVAPEEPPNHSSDCQLVKLNQQNLGFYWQEIKMLPTFLWVYQQKLRFDQQKKLIYSHLDDLRFHQQQMGLNLRYGIGAVVQS